MRSAQQRGTARANIAKFSQIANETERKLERVPIEASSSSQNGSTVADDVRRLNDTSAVNSNKPENQNITRNWELRSVGRRGSARDAINFFSKKDSTTDAPAPDSSNKAETNRRNEAEVMSQEDVEGARKISAEESQNFDKTMSNRNWDLRVIGRRGSARDTIKMFDNIARENKDRLDRNPFSETYSIKHYDTSAVDYGRPTHGSKTEARGIKAGDHVMREVLFLCEVINTHAEGEYPNRTIKFGPLFYIYAHYSEKLVGMLIRARKYKLVDFEGEMLYQRQDDDKIIRMLKPIEEIRKIVPSGDPVRCISVNDDSK